MEVLDLGFLGSFSKGSSGLFIPVLNPTAWHCGNVNVFFHCESQNSPQASYNKCEATTDKLILALRWETEENSSLWMKQYLHCVAETSWCNINRKHNYTQFYSLLQVSFQRRPVRVPGNLCVQLDWDGPSNVCIWTNQRRGVCLQLNGGAIVEKKGKCRRLSDFWGGAAEIWKHVDRHKNSLNYELNFLNLLKWTFKTQCTGLLVQLLFAAISLFFLPFCQNEGFWIKRCPQYCYTHRDRATEAYRIIWFLHHLNLNPKNQLNLFLFLVLILWVSFYILFKVL